MASRRRLGPGTRAPHLVVVAGPNGAGKSTAAPALLRDALEVEEFVNADTIATGLSAFRADRVGVFAGRLMLARLRALADTRRDFAFETTLASLTFGPWIRDLKAGGYRFSLVFLWLPGPDLAVSRVAARVRLGGHSVPEETVRRRYDRGLRNFFAVYRPLADHWRMLDNASAGPPRLIAAGRGRREEVVEDAGLWSRIAAYGEEVP